MEKFNSIRSWCSSDVSREGGRSLPSWRLGTLAAWVLSATFPLALLAAGCGGTVEGSEFESPGNGEDTESPVDGQDALLRGAGAAARGATGKGTGGSPGRTGGSSSDKGKRTECPSDDTLPLRGSSCTDTVEGLICGPSDCRDLAVACRNGQWVQAWHTHLSPSCQGGGSHGPDGGPTTENPDGGPGQGDPDGGPRTENPDGGPDDTEVDGGPDAQAPDGGPVVNSPPSGGFHDHGGWVFSDAGRP
jgi:hypothetical protein